MIDRLSGRVWNNQDPLLKIQPSVPILLLLVSFHGRRSPPILPSNESQVFKAALFIDIQKYRCMIYDRASTRKSAAHHWSISSFAAGYPPRVRTWESGIRYAIHRLPLSFPSYVRYSATRRISLPITSSFFYYCLLIVRRINHRSLLNYNRPWAIFQRKRIMWQE